MELESTQSNTSAKLPLLKRVTMKSETTTNDVGTSTTIIPGPVTIKEKAKKKNDVKQEEDLNLKFLRSLPSEWNTHVTGKKITINGSDIAGYEKSKVECFHCHKMGHFARECRVPRNQENINKNQETTKRTVNVEDTSSKAMVVFTSKIDSSHTVLPEFIEPNVKSYRVTPIEVVTQTSNVKISAPVKENIGVPLIEDRESDEEDEVESPPEKERKNVEPSVNKVEVEIPKLNDKPVRRPVKYAEMYRIQRPRGNQRN
nr:hypothetical protein [Tanacetum cinerariifolium]